MKDKMKPKSGNKISWFLRSKRSRGKSTTEQRRAVRRTSLYPNSSKLGAGELIASRRNTASIARKSSHRRKEGKRLFKIIRTYVKDSA